MSETQVSQELVELVIYVVKRVNQDIDEDKVKLVLQALRLINLSIERWKELNGKDIRTGT